MYIRDSHVLDDLVHGSFLHRRELTTEIVLHDWSQYGTIRIPTIWSLINWYGTNNWLVDHGCALLLIGRLVGARGGLSDSFALSLLLLLMLPLVKVPLIENQMMLGNFCSCAIHFERSCSIVQIAEVISLITRRLLLRLCSLSSASYRHSSRFVALRLLWH